MRNLAVVAVAAAALLFSSGACGKKNGDVSGAPTAEVTGLSAVPASAQVVIGVDVAKIAQSPLVARAIEQLLQRDPDLSARWQRLHDSCKLDLGTQVKRVMLAIGPPPHASTTGSAGSDSPPPGRPGTGPTVMIVTGTLVENDLSSCVRAMVGQGGGSLSGKDVDGRTLYQAKDGARTMFFAFGRPDTVILGANEDYVTEALGAGKKAMDDPDLKRVIGMADQKAPLWAAGRVDERVRAGLANVTQGKLSAGPSAFVVALDPSDGAKLELGAVMANAADAKTLESFAKTELGTLAMFAQIKSLQRVVDKIEVRSDDTLLRLSAHLTIDDVNQILSALDGSPPPAQGSAAPQP